ncbi:hypothetical protein ACFFP0_05265 [Rhizobium puerariae]|uniref:Uncharacterized protein n=1 Tax=Rhizobium puerariae TaxID=1585791 RepID=A0ABV6ACF9_9HYPH
MDALGTHILKMAERYSIEPAAGRVASTRAARSPTLDHIGSLPD